MKDMLGTIATGDCLTLLPRITSGSVKLAFADPPFNIGHEYDIYQDSRPRAEYLAWADQWLSELVRVISFEGSLVIAIGDEHVSDYKQRLDSLGLIFKNWIIWHYTFGVYQSGKFARCHTHLLYYVKSLEYHTWNPDGIRVPSARAEKYGDSRADPRGRVPGDVWTESRVCGTFKERVDHPAQMPISILDRLIKATTNVGDKVLDPFAGSGVSLVSAKKLGRIPIGMELSPSYAQQARKRLES